MEKIKIYHAFNGFLYAPVFLAERLGFFPQNTELIYTGADSKTIEELCKYSEEEKNWFAICDPFTTVDIGSSYPAETNDYICIIGSLINVLPFWVFNPDPNIHSVGSEIELEKYHNKFTKLIVYPKGTTGYLIGKRLQTKFGLNDQLVEERAFGEEFDQPISTKEVAVTADVLRIVHHGLDAHNVIFNYPVRSPQDLSPYLFTSILTLKSTVDSNLWTVLGVLGAIQAAINCLSVQHVRQDYIDILVQIFDTPQYGNAFQKIGLNSQQEKAELVRKSVNYLFRIQGIYRHYPKPADTEEWIGAWNNAKTLWIELGGTENSIEVTEQEEPIPSLLVRKEWKPLLGEYYKRLLSPVTPATPEVERQRREHLGAFDLRIIQAGIVMGVLEIIFLGYVFHRTFHHYAHDPQLIEKYDVAVLTFIGSIVATAAYFGCIYYYWRAALVIEGDNKSVVATVATCLIACLVAVFFFL